MGNTLLGYGCIPNYKGLTCIPQSVAMTDYDATVWTEPFTPNDEIGRRTGEEVHECKDCGLQTMVGTTDEIVHKRGCTHRGD